MLDVSTVSLTRETTTATALVTRAGDQDLEIRVWPPEDVWSVARRLDDAGLDWDAALPDESGLPGSLLVRRGVDALADDLAHLVAVLDAPGVAALGYHPAASDARGAWRRLPGSEPQGRDHVVFVELREDSVTGRWQVGAFGPLQALRRLHEALRDLTIGRGGAPRSDRSVALEIGARPGAVHEVVARLDAAGLDGHLRVLRRQQHA